MKAKLNAVDGVQVQKMVFGQPDGRSARKAAATRP